MDSELAEIQVPGVGKLEVKEVKDLANGKKEYKCIKWRGGECLAMDVVTLSDGGFEVYNRDSSVPFMSREENSRKKLAIG